MNNSFIHYQYVYIYIYIYMLHYNPRHVSSINMPIFRRTNYIITASGIVALCKRLYSMSDESRLTCMFYYTRFLRYSYTILFWCSYIGIPGQSALIRHTVQPFTDSDDTRCCDNTICPPEDGHVDARNMSRIVM